MKGKSRRRWKTEGVIDGWEVLREACRDSREQVELQTEALAELEEGQQSRWEEIK